MLSITDFKKKYPGNEMPVLSISQFNLPQGIYWIKGENGSGKTSLLKCMAGLLPFAGKIAVDGIDIGTNRMGYTKMVNYAEAEPQYPGFLSGKELTDFYLQTKGGQIPVGLLEKLGVDKFMKSNTAVYSSGMMKKLSLVLGFTGSPKLILLDEPLIALDVEAVAVLQDAISAYSRAGVSFIITSHQPMDPHLMAITRTLIIHDKTLLEEN